MKVLFLSSKDATNFRIVNIIKAFINKGHFVAICPLVLDEANIRMFRNIDGLKWVYDLNDEAVGCYDALFCANDTVWKVIKYNKYIFSFNCLTLGNAMSEGADFMFIPGYTDRYEFKERCAYMRIGNPIYDDYEAKNKITKNLLYIDSGHYPFGREGKRLIAKLLLDICCRFPDYTITVKPRYLKTDESPTHVNKNDLLSNILSIKPSLPNNLKYLDHHVEMRQLIDECDTVLCTYTSAWLDAAMAKKGLIIIDGLPNEDSKDLNNKLHWFEARNSMVDTGCLVDYRNVIDYLPNGITCSSDKIDQELVFKSDSSNRIVNVVEKVIDSNKAGYLSVGEYTYENIEFEIQKAKRISLNILQSDRIYNRAMNYATRLRDCIDRDIKLDYYIEQLDKANEKGLLRMEDLFVLDAYFRGLFEKTILEQKNKYISNDIAVSYVLPIIFRSDHKAAYNFIEELQYNNRAIKYYRARMAEDSGDYKTAITLLKEYIDDYTSAEYQRYYTDNKDIYISALFHIGWCYLKMHDRDNSLLYLDKCNQVEGGNHMEARKLMLKIRLSE